MRLVDCKEENWGDTNFEHLINTIVLLLHILHNLGFEVFYIEVLINSTNDAL